MFLSEELFEGYSITCNVISMGNDYALMVYGGDAPHIGSVVMSISRPSLTGEGVSATSSVINRIGHKDEAVARIFSEAVAAKKLCTVVCACGIHIDNITPEQIELVHQGCKHLLGKVLRALDGEL